jgi:hypothetical protein
LAAVASTSALALRSDFSLASNCTRVDQADFTQNLRTSLRAPRLRDADPRRTRKTLVNLA